MRKFTGIAIKIMTLGLIVMPALFIYLGLKGYPLGGRLCPTPGHYSSYWRNPFPGKEMWLPRAYAESAVENHCYDRKAVTE